MAPEFPLRIIYDDSECVLIESPEDLLDRLDPMDSTDVSSRVWIRDALDRTVRLRVRNGLVELLDV